MAVVRNYIDGQFVRDEQEPVGIDGFFTFAKISESESQTRDVPTTYLEDGSHVNDHIIRNPVSISITGNVSNTFVQPSPALAAIREAEAQVGAITQYAPGRTQTQLSRLAGLVADIQGAVDAADALYSRAGRFGGYVGLTGESGKTNIQEFRDRMNGLIQSEALIKIDSLGKTYENMCVTSIQTTQGNESNSLDFTLEAQEVRFAQVIFTQVAPSPARGTGGQTAGVADKGAQEGAEVPESTLSKIFGYFS